MKIINTQAAPKAIGPYSQAIQINNIIYTSGQLGIDPSTGQFKGDSIEDQTHQAIQNIAAILKEANSSLDNVVKTTVFVKEILDFNKINEIYAQYFINKPARSLVEVAKLPKDALIEIEVIACL